MSRTLASSLEASFSANFIFLKIERANKVICSAISKFPRFCRKFTMAWSKLYQSQKFPCSRVVSVRNTAVPRHAVYKGTVAVFGCLTSAYEALGNYYRFTSKNHMSEPPKQCVLCLKKMTGFWSRCSVSYRTQPGQCTWVAVATIHALCGDQSHLGTWGYLQALSHSDDVSLLGHACKAAVALLSPSSTGSQFLGRNMQLALPYVFEKAVCVCVPQP